MTPRFVPLLAALVATAGCGSQQARDARQAGETAEAPAAADNVAVSPEQVRAAQLLSLSGGAATEQRAGYAGAIDCAASLTLFVQTIADSPLIDETQAEALRRARGLFQARARSAGLAEGKSRSAVDADINRATDDDKDDPTASSRTAIACLRQLAGEAG